MPSGWLFGTLWCVCSSAEDVIMSYLGWLAIAAVSYTCQVHCIAHIENGYGKSLGCQHWHSPRLFGPCGQWERPGFTGEAVEATHDRRTITAKCDSIKPKVSPLRKCGRCVQGMDHCPWTNNCVGPQHPLPTLCSTWASAASTGWRYSVGARTPPRLQATDTFRLSSVLVQPMCWLGSFLLCAAFLVFVVAMWSDQHHRYCCSSTPEARTASSEERDSGRWRMANGQETRMRWASRMKRRPAKEAYADPDRGSVVSLRRAAASSLAGASQAARAKEHVSQGLLGADGRVHTRRTRACKRQR